MHFSKSFQGSKSAKTICLVSTESTLLFLFGTSLAIINQSYKTLVILNQLENPLAILSQFDEPLAILNYKYKPIATPNQLKKPSTIGNQVLAILNQSEKLLVRTN